MSDNRSGEVAEPVDRRRRLPSFFWPLVLIGVGVMLLLSNLGYLPWVSWNVLWRLWPLLLIALGVDVLIGRRSMLGAIVSGLLIAALIGGAVLLVLFAQDIPALSNVVSPTLHIRHVEYPRGDLKRATVEIDWSSAPGYLSALRDSSRLIEGEVAYRGELVFDADVRGDYADVLLDSYVSGPWFGSFQFGDREDIRWDVALSPDVSIDLILDTGSGSCEFDLTGLQIEGLFLDVGSGSVDLTVPNSGAFGARIDGGSGALTIVLPEDMGARIVLDSGSGTFRPDDRFRLVDGGWGEDGVWETEHFDAAEHAIELKIDQGSGAINIR